jgi:ferritin-like metal-binding protein YciE
VTPISNGSFGIPEIASDGIHVIDVTDFSTRIEILSSLGVSTTLNRGRVVVYPQANEGVDMPQLTTPAELFTHKLGAALTMEQTVLQMLQTLEQNAHDAELKERFAHHRNETEQQIANLNQVFSALGEQPGTQPCPTIDGLKEESEMMISQSSDELIDAVLLSGAAETEHHEIAVYEGLIANADEMGQDDIVALLTENLEQEQHTLKKVEAATKKQAKRLADQAAA